MVEWKTIGDIVKRNKGIPITAGQMSELNSPDGNIRVFAAGQTIADIDEANLPKGCAHKKPSIIVKSRGYIDFEFYDKPFTHKNEMWSYSFDDFKICKFIYYYLTTKTEEFRKKARANSVKLPQLCVADTDNYIIPIPSLEEQNRIVGILDTFTDSIENLKQQIAQRRKQYEFYRDQLLFSFKQNAIVSEVSTFAKGRIDAKCLNADNYVSVENLLKDKAGKTISSVVPTEGNWVMYKENDILIGNIRPYLRKIWFSDRCGGTNGDVLVIRPNEKVIPRYLFFVLSSERFFIYYNQTAKGGKMPRGEKARALQFDFYLPSTKEQSRIVSILDTFEASITNLEAQLAQRQKQYEYYRNQLLTFE